MIVVSEKSKDVWRPDVYICNNCKERFAKAKYIEIKKDDIVFQRTVCPKCNSENIRMSSWTEEDFKKDS